MASWSFLGLRMVSWSSEWPPVAQNGFLELRMASWSFLGLRMASWSAEWLGAQNGLLELPGAQMAWLAWLWLAGPGWGWLVLAGAI